MTATTLVALIRLDDTDATVANPNEDVRGRIALDRKGEEIGDVKSILADDREHKARFLEDDPTFARGSEPRLIPVEAVKHIGEQTVQVDQSRSRVKGSPEQDAELGRDEDFYRCIYGYYGYAPLWMVGYAYPGYPYY